MSNYINISASTSSGILTRLMLAFQTSCFRIVAHLIEEDTKVLRLSTNTNNILLTLLFKTDDTLTLVMLTMDIVYILINELSCDVNLATSILSNKRELLNHKQYHILTYYYQYHQPIHYYLSTSKRSNQLYVDILNLFMEKLKLTNNSLNIQEESERTLLHIAIYHDSGTIDSTTHVEEILIDNGNNLFIKGKSGNIPLHNVLINNNVDDNSMELCVLITKSVF
ncbi:unnamed protein product [Rotaria sordida]|uniref:Ankyrin repeat protein n=1 Tax=Rotaria sordida TaxID=392033 RepID=A0A819CTB9_9BILA|nr:unnamed protein product [Rotaria sordida]CAF3821123.1 unnamed protein product [Rotaria sordida]